MAHQPTPTDPPVAIDVVALTRRIATACKNNGITTDAQWSSFIATRFNATNASGLSAGTRTLLIEFFDKLVKIG